MAYTAFFDESGIHRGSKVTVVAGLLGDVRAWAKLDASWRTILEKFELTYFHSVDCEKGNGQFLGKHPGPIRSSIAMECASAIADANLVIFGSAFVVDDWHAAAPEELRLRFPSAYLFCFEFLMQKLSRWWIENEKTEQVNVVFSEQNEYESDALRTFGFYSRDSHFGTALGEARYAPMKVTPELQAADMLCYETYRRALAGPNAPVRDPLRRMLEGAQRIYEGYFDEESFRVLAKKGPKGTMY